MGAKPLGVIMLTCATFIWGTSLVAQSLGMQHMGPFVFNALRFLIGGTSVLLFIILHTKIRSKKEVAHRNPSKEKLAFGGIACGVVLFITASFQQVGICTTTVGKAGFITALYIIIVPLLGVLLGKRAPAAIWGCAIVATAGMFLLCINEEFLLSTGDTYVFLCAVTTSVHILLIGYFAPLADAVKLSCIQFLVCGALSALCAFAFEPIQINEIVGGWAPILYTGVLSCAVAYTFQALGQREINPILTSLIFSFEAVFAALSGWLILGEGLSGKEIFGCILIFAAILAAQSPKLWRTPAYTELEKAPDALS